MKIPAPSKGCLVPILGPKTNAEVTLVSQPLGHIFGRSKHFGVQFDSIEL